MDAAGLRHAHEWLDRTAPAAQRIEAVDADVPSVLRDGPAVVDQAAADPADSDLGHTRHRHDHGEQFETWVAHPTHVVSAVKWHAALRAMPRGVLRLKGYLRIDETPPWAQVQFAGRHGSLHRLAAVPVEAPVLVAIGLAGQLPIGALNALVAPDVQAAVSAVPAR